MEPLEQAPAEPAAPEIEAVPEFDPAAAQRDLERAQADLATLNQRLADTQRWGQEAHRERQAAIAALDRVTAERQATQPQQQQPQQWAPPTLSDDEKDRLLSDPDYTYRKIWEAATTAAAAAEQATRARYEPYLQQVHNQLAQASALLPAAMEPAALSASSQAAATLEARFGMDVNEYTALLPAASETLWRGAGGDMGRFNQMRSNPQIVAHAVLDARLNSNTVAPPRERPPIPPSLPSSSRAAPAPSGFQPPPELAQYESVFGKFSPEQWKDIMSATEGRR